MPFDNTRIDSGFFKNIPSFLAKKGVKRLDSITVYRALLREELVDRDGLPEYKLINVESKQPKADLAGSKNYHELFICQVFTNNKADTACVFLASSYNVHDKCTRLGPAYLGWIRMNEIVIKNALSVKKTNDSTYFIADTSKTELFFIAEQPIVAVYEKLCKMPDPEDSSSLIDVPPPADSLCRIQLKTIINSNINKIGGKKPTLYLIEKTFGDKDALLFRYFKTIKYPNP